MIVVNAKNAEGDKHKVPKYGWYGLTIKKSSPCDKISRFPKEQKCSQKMPSNGEAKSYDAAS